MAEITRPPEFEHADKERAAREYALAHFRSMRDSRVRWCRYQLRRAIEESEKLGDDPRQRYLELALKMLGHFQRLRGVVEGD